MKATPYLAPIMKLSPWLPIPDAPYCCARIREGGDINKASDRIAFIEKTPRVRIRVNMSDCGQSHSDWLNWAEAPFSGPGGIMGHVSANQLYGHAPASRQWCDDMLRLLGYELA